MFKKKKINTKTNKQIVNFFGLTVILFVFIFGLFTISQAKKMDFFQKEVKMIGVNEGNDKRNDEKNKEVEENKKNENKINILLIGRGGRLNDAPNLTDTILLASINKKYKTISMFSIPRDLYVEYKNGKKGRINKIYALEEHKTGSEEAGMDALKYNVEAITGEKIDFYIDVDFEGFIKFIDAIGGIKITVPKKLVDYKFPDNNWGYTTFVIRKGTWLFDGETALKYARSRHSTSDFDRSLRQQQIIKSVRDKFVNGGFFENLSNIKKAYDIFVKYVQTDISLSDAISLFSEVKDKEYKIISSNLNDSCFEGDNKCVKGGFLYTPERELFGGASILLVDGSMLGSINNYKRIKKYLYLIFDNPEIFKENIEIGVFNSTKVPLLAGNTAFEIRRYGFNIPFSKTAIGTIRQTHFEKSVINYKSDIKDSETLKFLKQVFSDVEFKEVEDLEYSESENAKIEIIIGKDYKKVFDNLESNL